MVVFLLEDAGAEHSPLDRWGGTPLDDVARAMQAADDYAYPYPYPTPTRTPKQARASSIRRTHSTRQRG